MNFRSLKIEDMPEILKWRNQCSEALRTSYDLTLEQQQDWYYDLVCNRQANARWWGIEDDYGTLVGYVGIENIQWENRLGEISLLINPGFQGMGFGENALDRLLFKGFNTLNLDNLYGECFESNNAVYFWSKMIQKYNGTRTTLPNRKYYIGRYWDSLYFNFNKGDFYN